MSQTSTRTPTDLKDSNGHIFARVAELPDGGNAALFRSTNNEGQMCLKLLMRAYGMESSTDISYPSNPVVLDAVIQKLDQEQLEKAHGMLCKSLEENAPQFVSIYKSSAFLADFNLGPSIPKDVAKIHSVAGQDFLVVRQEHKVNPEDVLGASESCLLVVGPSVEQVFKFAGSQQRENAFGNPAQLDDIVGQVHTRQLGASVGAAATSRSKLRNH